MASDTLASLHEPPSAPEQVRAPLQATANSRVPNLEKAVRARLHLGEAYYDLPGHAPIPVKHQGGSRTRLPASREVRITAPHLPASLVRRSGVGERSEGSGDLLRRLRRVFGLVRRIRPERSKGDVLWHGPFFIPCRRGVADTVSPLPTRAPVRADTRSPSCGAQCPRPTGLVL